MNYSVIESNETLTRGGVKFSINSSIWVIENSHTRRIFDFTEFEILASDNWILSLKRVLVWYLESRSLEHSFNLYSRTLAFLRFLRSSKSVSVSIISDLDILNYRGSLEKKHVWYVGVLAGLFFKWFELGYAGVSREAVSLLKTIRNPGNIKGEAVLTQDAINGPFSSFEVDAITTELRNRHFAGEISTRSYLLALLFMTLGLRPSQVSLLRVSDIVGIPSDSQGKECLIRVPRVKQRQVARKQFTDRLLVPDIGKLMLQYSAEVSSNCCSDKSEESDTPLFPRRKTYKNKSSCRVSLSVDVKNELFQILDSLNVYSERTGEKVHITPTRFRRTLGTRAAEEGHGELIIAALLDHTDTQNVGVYTQATPTMVDRIDKAMAFQMAPLAQAFAGKVASTDRKAQLSKHKYSAVINPEIDPACAEMGGCGNHSHCNYSAPVACYTCVSFTAWDDGPHEQVLDYLLAERERKIAQSDLRIASINDRAILAVAEVIKKCQQLKATGQEI